MLRRRTIVWFSFINVGVHRRRKKWKLTLVALLCFVLSLARSSETMLKVWKCVNQYRDGATSHERIVDPTWIETVPGVAGILQTPNFPHHFPLPVQCVWVFNNTRTVARQRYLHIYFTQFYLSQGFVTFSELDHSEWPFSTSKNPDESRKLSWNQIRNLGKQESSDFGTQYKTMMSNNSYVIVLLNVTKQSYDLLHKRVLEVSDSYGFNITFETSYESESRRQICSLKNCNLNGECLTTSYNETALKGFFCKCTYPRSAPTETEPFEGEHCQYLTKGYCSLTRNRCLNGGMCNYFTSRYVQCECPKGWTGTKCEKKVENQSESGKVCSKGHQAGWDVPFSSVNRTHRRLVGLIGQLKRFGRIDVFKSGFITPTENATIVIQTEVCLDDGVLERLSSWLSTKLLRGRKVPLRLSFLKITDMASDIGSFVFEEEDFQISCSVFGAVKPVFRMFQGPYQINSTLAYKDVRHISLDARQDGSRRWNGVLLMTKASVWDDGIFHCRVYDVGSDPIPGDDELLRSYPMVSTTKGIRIVVVTRPKVEVFPLSTTLIKDNTRSYKYATGNNALHCFASSEALHPAPENYVFTWKKNHRPIKPKNSTVEYVEEMGVKGPPGLTLKLGRINSGAVYTCEVYDRRENVTGVSRRFVTRVDVEVSVADSVRDTCSDGVKGRIVWPRTMQGKTASTICLFAKGHLSRKCNPTNPRNAPQWSETLDESQCVRERFLLHIHRIERLFRGYVKSVVDYNFPSIFLRGIRDASKSRPPSVAEWRANVKIIWQLLDYIELKPDVQFDYESLLVDFYSKTLPWLSGRGMENHKELMQPPYGRSEDDRRGSGIPLHIGPTGARRVFEIFKLVNKSIPLFGSRVASERPFVIPDHLERGSNHVDSNELMSECFDGLIYVKLVKLEPSSKGNLSMVLQKSQGNKSCPGLTGVRVSVKAGQEETVLAVIHFKDLESVLNRVHKVDESRSVLRYSRNSSLVTVLLDSKHENVPINASIRFYDFALAKNDSSVSNFTCGRVTFSGHNRYRWERKDPHCKLVWNPDGLTCICSRSGTYALIRSTRILRAHISGSIDRHPNVVPYCCAGSLTICILTLMVLVKNFFEQSGSWIALIHMQVSILMSGIMVSVILVVAEFVKEDQYYRINAALQFMFLSAISCQLVIVVHSYRIVHQRHFHAKQRQGPWLLGSALGTLVLPAIYCLVFTSFVNNGDEHNQTKHGRALRTTSWFLKTTGTQFFIFVFTNLVLCMIYSAMSFLSMRKSPWMLPVKESKRLSAVKQSVWMMLAMSGLEICLLVYVNGKASNFAEYYLASPCVAVGIVLFCCYVIQGGNSGSSGEAANNTTCEVREGLSAAGKKKDCYSILARNKSDASPPEPVNLSQVRSGIVINDDDDEDERFGLLTDVNKSFCSATVRPDTSTCRYSKRNLQVLDKQRSGCTASCSSSGRTKHTEVQNSPLSLSHLLLAAEQSIPLKTLTVGDSFSKAVCVHKERVADNESHYVKPNSDSKYMFMKNHPPPPPAAASKDDALDPGADDERGCYVPFDFSRGRQTSSGVESTGLTSSEPENSDGNDFLAEDLPPPTPEGLFHNCKPAQDYVYDEDSHAQELILPSRNDFVVGHPDLHHGIPVVRSLPLLTRP